MLFTSGSDVVMQAYEWLKDGYKAHVAAITLVVTNIGASHPNLRYVTGKRVFWIQCTVYIHSESIQDA